MVILADVKHLTNAQGIGFLLFVVVIAIIVLFLASGGPKK